MSAIIPRKFILCRPCNFSCGNRSYYSRIIVKKKKVETVDAAYLLIRNYFHLDSTKIFVNKYKTELDNTLTITLIAKLNNIFDYINIENVILPINVFITNRIHLQSANIKYNKYANLK